jgi:hypothetical protein
VSPAKEHGGLATAVNDSVREAETHPFHAYSWKGTLQRRVRDTAGIVRDGRGRDDGDRLEQQILAKPGRQEPLDVLLIEPPALFDERPRQSGECAKLAVRRRAASAHRLDIRRIDTSLQAERGMERDGM